MTKEIPTVANSIAIVKTINANPFDGFHAVALCDKISLMSFFESNSTDKAEEYAACFGSSITKWTHYEHFAECLMEVAAGISLSSLEEARDSFIENNPDRDYLVVSYDAATRGANVVSFSPGDK